MKAIADLNRMAMNGLQMWLEHDGEEAFFQLAMFKRNYFDDAQETFTHINRYWAQMPMDKQVQIFRLYQSIAEDFDSLMNREMLKTLLTQKVTQLMDLHDLAEIENWVRFQSGITIPSNFTEEYVENIDKNTTPDKTYTRGEYIQLVSLSLALRAMVPIWGSYIKTIRAETGNAFKEHSAFLLLKESKIYNSATMDKLACYIRAQIGKDAFNPVNTLDLISSEDFPRVLLAVVCVKRLCVGDIRSKEANQNLASLVYNTISQRVLYGESDYTNVVKSKKADDFGPDGENKISNLERFKTSASISLGQITEMEYSMRDIYQCSVKLCPELDIDLLDRSLSTAVFLTNVKIMPPQMTLLRWVFSPVIPPRGVPYLPRQIIINALGALEAILWTRGHRYLALLATSYAIIDDTVHRVSHIASRMRPTENNTEELRKYFPYTQVFQGKNGTVNEVCLVSEAINKISSEFTRFTWRATAHEELLMGELGNVTRRIPAIPDLKNEITKLVIELGKTPK